MGTRNRSNPLALAVLISLYERPMHPYEVATTLRQRNKHESVRLNYGSLYAVVASLERRGLIAPQETARAGRLPERTVYDLTEAGRIETHDWLTDLIATPVKDYPAFEAALESLRAGYGVEPVGIGCGGSIGFVGPLAELFGGAPALLLGIEDPLSNAHAPNESLDGGDFRKLTASLAHLFTRLGSLPSDKVK